MTAAAAWSVALVGMEGTMIEVEAAIGNGLPKTVLVGLPDTALYEARDRCHAAVSSAGIAWPSQLLTINLSPATLPKGGSHYDLAIVTAVLAAAGMVPRERAARVVLMGELGLDGRVRPVRGILPGLLAAQDAGFDAAVVPASQVGEASLADGMTIWGVRCLTDMVEVLHGRPVALPAPQEARAAEPGHRVDLADVVGQEDAKYALEVAAAGRHHLFLSGPPGVGKTMLAERLPGLLPPLSRAESLEVSAIHSMAGHDLNHGLVSEPPFADPHHSATLASLIGSGVRVPRPGAVSLAHRGVLFLDEAPQFGATKLDALRTPLESGWVRIDRAQVQARFPARFQLVLAANPCPCGNHGTAGAVCTCAPMQVRRYVERLSGPILDRMDLTENLVPVRRAYLAAAVGQRTTTAEVMERVVQARERQAHRLRGTPWLTNGEVPGPYLRGSLPTAQGLDLLDRALVTGLLSSRGADKVMRVAWTIADLEGHATVLRDDMHAALQMRRGRAGEAA
ncbi:MULTISPECIES: YifB family Mg chelatase-like AAA ATPase [unclassified Luteococcus]|uniref:YifB family Mg chelatase-like AAA ATPase n=1 Tax=unclassified Luteococcus TaxID=2639923 RepID=UPI00313BBA5B